MDVFTNDLSEPAKLHTDIIFIYPKIAVIMCKPCLSYISMHLKCTTATEIYTFYESEYDYLYYYNLLKYLSVNQ